MQDALTCINPILVKVKAIVAYFDRSSAATERFSTMQTSMNPSQIPLKLKMDVATRWNSTLHMLERLVRVQEPLEATIGILQNPVDSLTSSEWNTIKDFCLLLEPFDVATIEMSAENNISISKVIVVVCGIQCSINANRKKFTSATSLQLSDCLLNNLATRFFRIEENMIMAVPTYLDPRFKRKGFTSDSALAKCREFIQR